MRERYIAIISIGLIIVGFVDIVNIDLRKFLPAQIGPISVMVGVESNEYNILAEQLSEKEKELTLKEEELFRRAELLAGQSSKNLLYSFIGWITLLCLIIFNFYLDYFYRHRATSEHTFSIEGKS